MKAGMVCVTAVLLGLGSAPAAELEFGAIQGSGYSYLGGVFPDGWFPTNLVQIPPNIETNLNTGDGFSGFATNRFSILSGTSIAATHDFELAGVGRGGTGARGGLRGELISFTVRPSAAHPIGGTAPFQGKLQTKLNNTHFDGRVDVRMSIRQVVDTDPKGVAVWSQALTNSGLTLEETLFDRIDLVVGESYLLQFLLAAAVPLESFNVGGILSGQSVVSLEETFRLGLTRAPGSLLLDLDEAPGEIVLEWSTNHGTWLPLQVDPDSNGVFHLSTTHPTAFFRGVRP